MIFITGGHGFIGSALRLSLKEPAKSYDIKFGKDVLDLHRLTAEMDGCQTVVHLAAICGIDRTMGNPVETMQVILKGTMNVYQAALANGVKRVVNVSTSEVFGPKAYEVAEEDATTLGPVGQARWTYAVSKLAMEHYGNSLYEQYGIEVVNVRPFNIYGPGQKGEGAVHTFIDLALKGERIYIRNGGTQVRSWCYIEDMVQGLKKVIYVPNLGGQTFNIGCPDSTLTIRELAEKILTLTNSSSEIIDDPISCPDVEIRKPNIDKAMSILEYRPRWTLEQGLAETIEYYAKIPKAGVA